MNKNRNKYICIDCQDLSFDEAVKCTHVSDECANRFIKNDQLLMAHVHGETTNPSQFISSESKHPKFTKSLDVESPELLQQSVNVNELDHVCALCKKLTLDEALKCMHPSVDRHVKEIRNFFGGPENWGKESETAPTVISIDTKKLDVDLRAYLTNFEPAPRSPVKHSEKIKKYEAMEVTDDMRNSFDPRDVMLVMKQADVSYNVATLALHFANGDLVNAIMDLTD
jgi:NACalpha-BTF3-like transcription factor